MEFEAGFFPDDFLKVQQYSYIIKSCGEICGSYVLEIIVK